MYSFFVLGQIPGTGLVITFSMWMEAASLLAALLIWMSYRRRQAALNYSQPTIGSEPGSLQTVTAQ